MRPCAACMHLGLRAEGRIVAKCFISYTRADEPWAKWIATTLREAGHQVTMQASDFRPGENFVLGMQETASEADHTLVVLSNRYLGSGFGAVEWAAAFAANPTGANRKLIPISVEPIVAPGLWKAIVRVELYGKSEEAARALIVEAVEPNDPYENSPFPASQMASDLPGTSEGAERAMRPEAIEVWRLPASTSMRQHQESGMCNHMHPVSCYDIFFCDGALLIFQLPVESHMSYRGRMDMLHIIGLVRV